MRKLILLLTLVLCLANYVFAQLNQSDLPINVQNLLDQKFPQWKLVKNSCQTIVSGDFNNDEKLDYTVLITSKKGGNLVGFISNGNSFLLVPIESLDKRDAEISAISPTFKVKAELDSRLSADTFTLSTCQFNDGVTYIFKDGEFVIISDDFGKKNKDADNDQMSDEFIVKGPNPWLNTGIEVEQGCIVILYPQGKVDVNAGWGVHDARGTENFYNAYNYPVLSRFRYGLAAQITNSSTNSRDKNRDAWGYEYEGTHLAKKSGRLWLVVNDDNPQDNLGEFRVRVKLICDK